MSCLIATGASVIQKYNAHVVANAATSAKIVGRPGRATSNFSPDAASWRARSLTIMYRKALDSLEFAAFSRLPSDGNRFRPLASRRSPWSARPTHQWQQKKGWQGRADQQYIVGYVGDDF